MANYAQWNYILATAYTNGLASGSQVYLDVDEDAIRRVGENWLAPHGVPEPAGGWIVDFEQSVAAFLVQDGTVSLRKISGESRDGVPKGAAFLAAMVLAASRMADDAQASELNYFTRLSSILDVSPPGGGRPRGLEPGLEEPTWRTWNAWLGRMGFISTAVRGPEGARKYINYPLSQALLRETEREKLVRIFTSKLGNAKLDYDGATLAAIVEEAGWPTTHIRDVMSGSAGRRSAGQEAILDVYNNWLIASGALRPSLSGSLPATPSGAIQGGLFRSEDPVTGEIGYYLYPRVPRQREIPADAWVNQDGTNRQLVRDRSGWFQPLGEIDSAALDGGKRYPLTGFAGLDAVALPQRSFWTLVPDPEDIDSGQYGSWSSPRLGEPFILLAKSDLESDLNLLRDEGLLCWSGEPVETMAGFFEYRRCFAVGESWEGVFTKNRQLHAELRPRSATSISLSGGLRDRDGQWLVGCPPSVTVRSFERSATLEISRVGGSLVTSLQMAVNEPRQLHELGPGQYELSVGGLPETRRLVRFTDWSDVSKGVVTRAQSMLLGDLRLKGALISHSVEAPE